MLFSSTQFLFAFLPIVLLVYYFASAVLKSRVLSNIVLTISSVLFYAYGEPKFWYIMLAVVLLDWLFALMISEQKNEIAKKICLFLAIASNLSVLFIFKYLDFSIQQINTLFNSTIALYGIVLPIGISFFTFQAISYVVDVYRGVGKVLKNPLYVVEYIAFFPQLIAGPIVRYSDIYEEVLYRKETFSDFNLGCKRFIIGLGKKVLIANNLAIVADSVFESYSYGTELALCTAWIGLLCYTLQIYFDFSGYSDMAIGLGLMFGFHFRENFDYPYISKSITEFWRRWHISLGSWFRDYIYIPLGGNRVTSKRHIFNMFIVWSLTGIWHGANWTFLIWGLMYFLLLVFEKYLKMHHSWPNIIKHFYTMFFVMLGWVFFRSLNLIDAVSFCGVMFGLGNVGFMDNITIEAISEYGIIVVAGIFGSIPILRKIPNNVFLEIIGDILVFVLSVSFLIKGAYNPFIYFNF